MRPQLTHFTLAALLGLAQCRSHTSSPSQEPLNINRDQAMTVVLQDTIAVKHPADVANVNIRVKASSSTKEDAFRLTRQRMSDVENTLGSFMPAKGIVGDDEEAGWSSSGVGIDYSYRWKDQDDEEDDVEEESSGKGSKNRTVKAIGSICARFHDVDMLRAFATEVSKTHESTVFGQIDWDLSKAAQKVAKVGLRRKAVQQLVESGEGYLDALGFSKATPVEFEEMYSYVNSPAEERGRCGRMWYGDEEEDEAVLQELLKEQWEVPVLEMHSEMKCKLRLE